MGREVNGWAENQVSAGAALSSPSLFGFADQMG